MFRQFIKHCDVKLDFCGLMCVSWYSFELHLRIRECRMWKERLLTASQAKDCHTGYSPPSLSTPPSPQTPKSSLVESQCFSTVWSLLIAPKRFIWKGHLRSFYPYIPRIWIYSWGWPIFCGFWILKIRPQIKILWLFKKIKLLMLIVPAW